MRRLTPPGISGVAVFAFSSEERHLLRGCLRGAGGLPFPHGPVMAPVRASLVLDGAHIDDVLIVDRGAAGDELHTHGSPVVVDLVGRHFRADGEDRGTTSAMALARRAISIEQLSLAQEQAGYSFSAELERLERLGNGARRSGLLGLIRRSRQAMAMSRPFRIVLVGLQNVGKSTLFNKLVGRNRAAAGPLAGLTRDAVREILVLDGYVYELCDAAGEGEGARDVDAAAIDMARAWRRDAAWLVVLDATRQIDERERAWARQAALIVRNKADLGIGAWPLAVRAIEVSARDEDGAGLRSAIGLALRRSRGLGGAGPVGGVAAIDEDQVGRLLEHATRHGLEGDCDGLRSPA